MGASRSFGNPYVGSRIVFGLHTPTEHRIYSSYDRVEGSNRTYDQNNHQILLLYVESVSKTGRAAAREYSIATGIGSQSIVMGSGCLGPIMSVYQFRSRRVPADDRPRTPLGRSSRTVSDIFARASSAPESSLDSDSAAPTVASSRTTTDVRRSDAR